MFTIQNEYFCVIGQHIRHPKKKFQSIMLKNKNTMIFLLNAYN